MILHGLNFLQVNISKSSSLSLSLSFIYLGDYYFTCWNNKKIEKLELYWTNQGIQVLINKQATYRNMVNNRHAYTHSQIHQFCRIPVSREYFG